MEFNSSLSTTTSSFCAGSSSHGSSRPAAASPCCLKLTLEGLGWYVQPGLKFGAHLVLYEDQVHNVHARYAVIIANSQTTWRDIVGASRLTARVAKQLLVAVPQADVQSLTFLRNDSVGKENGDVFGGFELFEVMPWVPVKIIAGKSDGKNFLYKK